jgi:signal transduction histidine kinase
MTLGGCRKRWYCNYDIDINDNSEGDISILKNHLFDITRILKENKELLERDKIYLKNAIADISHQLKTPLTSLYLVNEILCNEKDETKRNEFLIKMRDELERIEWLVSSLLKMSKLDSKTVVLRDDTIEVSALIQHSVSDLASLINSKKIDIKINNKDNITLKGDFNWLKEALINIIKNGLEHTNEDGHINIDVSDNPLYTKIVIKDNGEGIAPADIPYIFDRFYKPKGSSKNSLGIGLALAKSIINSQNGAISVKSKLGEYTAFTIKVYKMKNY